MKIFWVIWLLVCMCQFSCIQDDNAIVEELVPEQVIPQIAVIGTDLTTGNFPYLKTWDDTYGNVQTDFLPDILDYSSGFLKNTIDGKIAVASGFPPTEFITYDINQETIARYQDFFTPENELGNSFLLNTDKAIATFYLDMDSTCCNVYLHDYDIENENEIEFFLGNLDVTPVQFNTYVKGNKAFLTGIDTFTGVKKLFAYNLETNLSLGTVDISNYDGYFYNDELDEFYLFDFGGSMLTYDILNLNFFTVSESAAFVEGVTAESGFNDARFEDGKMIFKQNFVPQSSVPLDAIYDFQTQSLISFEGTDIINRIVGATGIGISILDTEVDLENNVYIVSGTYLEDGQMKGLVVFMTLDKEVLLSVDTDIIRPEEIILLN